MKVNEYQKKNIPEDRIDFYYRMKTKEVNEILDFLKKHSQRLSGRVNNKKLLFSLNDVYYFESVDKKTFAYLGNEVVQMDISLQDLENAYFESGFIRVNKSTVLNVYKISSLKPGINMRVMALLDNGEKIQINRTYKARFNLFLNTMDKGGFQNETGK
ncbi:MAG: LytTR family transcriptional regulator [Lachnospiraceae bacterium]|nr:LytTR family transcriptional regulator [Lachnospiraceae bacterium]